ncbi:MAG: recombinase family protein [Pseudoflavonifractor sp.]|nr:recombinase family protein [Pseudoflavonifractor sp.]
MPYIVNQSAEYCMYLRKSRLDMEAEARGEGDTLARHRRALFDLAKQMGIVITQIYQEVVSGETIDARPEVQKLLTDVESGRWKGVLCMEVERLARGNTSDQGLVADTFKYSDTKIVTPFKIYDPSDEFDEEFFEFGLFRSRMEYRTINRRLQRGREASLREGKFIAGKACYGYERYKLPKQKGWSLRVIPEQAELVKEIFNWYVYGEVNADGSTVPLGCYSIAKKLDRMGIPSPTGGKWPPCTVKGIIQNPTYIGKIRWSHRPTVKLMVNGRRVTTRPINGEVPLCDGIHEPILDEETWAKAQHVLNSRSNPPVPKSSRIRNPLAGLVYCSKCGRSMERRKFQHGRETLMCPNKDCDCMSSTLETVEEAVLDALRNWLAEYKVKMSKLPAAECKSVQSAQNDVTHLEQALAALEKQRNNLYGLLENGIYSTELFMERSKVIADKISETQAALDAARLRANSGKILQRNRFEIIPKVEHVLNTYPELTDVAAKNALLKEVLNKVVYLKAQGGMWKESDLQVFLFPKIEAVPASLR